MSMTKFGVDKLVNHMIRKYGIVDAIIALKNEYKYNIKATSRDTVFMDSNRSSRFYGTTYTKRVVLTEQQRNLIQEALDG